MTETQTLSPKYRMWLWIFATLLGTAPLIGILFQLSRITEVPLILGFAPAVLLGPHIGAETALRGIYYLLPLQCLAYGLLMARSEISGTRSSMLTGLLIAHCVIAMRAYAVTGGVLPN